MSDPSSLHGQRFDLCVLGAGVSGLGLARLAAGRLNLKTLVLERQAQAGGCLSSIAVPGAGAATGWLELGAHTCYNSYAGFLDLMKDTPFLDQVTPRKNLGFRMVEGGRLRSIPSCLDFLELALSVPKLFWAAKQGQTAQAYYSRVLGRKNWDRVLHPSLNAVASQETRNFPADALFKKRGQRRKDVVRSFALRGGLGSAVQVLAEHPLIQCARGREATAVSQDGEGFQVRTAQGEVIQARRVALAVPAPVAAALVAQAFPELSRHLAGLENRVVQSLGLVFKDPLAHLPPLAGLILPEGPCFSAVSGDAFPVPGKRAWSFHFDGARAGSQAEMVAYACQVLGAAPELVETAVRKDHAMPVLTLGHDAWVAALDRMLPGTGLAVVGNYLAGMSIEDCSGRALREFQRLEAEF